MFEDSLSELFTEDAGARRLPATVTPQADSAADPAARPASHITTDAALPAAILATVADAIVGVDAQGCVVSANPATTSVFGVSPEEVIGRPLSSLLPALDAAAIEAAIRAGIWLHAGRCYVSRQQLSGLRVGGVAFPVDVSISEVPGDGRVRYACIVRDITEAKLAEESFHLYSRALECSHNAVMISDASRQPQPVVFVNAAFTRITGYEPHEVLGRPASFLAGEDGDEEQVLAMAMDSGHETTVTLRARHRDGHAFYGQLSVSPVRDAGGTVTHSIGIMSDVTARVEAERAIAERSARLDTIFDLSPDGFALFDARKRLVFVNPALQAVTGRQWVAGVDGISLSTFDAILRSLCDPAMPYPPLDADDEGTLDETPRTDRLHLVRPEHRVLQREVRHNRHHNGPGETILYLRDITRETEVDRMKSEFLSTAAHELRTPLASIFGFTELMLRRKYPEERKTDMLQTMHRQASLLVKLLNELLDLARIEARQGKDFKIAEHALDTLVASSIHALTLPDTTRPVEQQLEPGLRVLADPDKLTQAMTNLLSNAYKYSPEGGTISVRTRADTEGDKPFAVIEVRDQGIGMSPAQLERAFERFYRADPSGNIPGTGLGLCLVKEIVELLGGRIELESAPGQGTCARVWIPAATS